MNIVVDTGVGLVEGFQDGTGHNGVQNLNPVDLA